MVESTFNNKLKSRNKKQIICGIDEAGRGCLAGDLSIAGSVFKTSQITIQNLTDSKKLTELKREKLFDEIKAKTFYKIVSFSSADVDNLGISKLINSALNQIIEYFNNLEELKNREIKFIFDGNSRFGISKEIKNFETLVKADSKIDEVSASSILAKVTRDRAILEVAKKYPEFGFESHKGYGTKKHIENIEKYDLTEFHRKSFKIKKKTPSLF
jgi:ribonuclease HII